MCLCQSSSLRKPDVAFNIDVKLEVHTVVIETFLSENKDKCMLNVSSLFMILIY